MLDTLKNKINDKHVKLQSLEKIQTIHGFQRKTYFSVITSYTFNCYLHLL